MAFNDPVVTSAIQHVESNYEAIRSEYFAAVLGQGIETTLDGKSRIKPLEPDYDVASKGGEHADDALHEGMWDWHSYILNGVKNEAFKERCPKTAQVVDDVSIDANRLLLRLHVFKLILIMLFSWRKKTCCLARHLDSASSQLYTENHPSNLTLDQ